MIFGIDKLIEDLRGLGFPEVELIQDPAGNSYALLKSFEVGVGRFSGRIVDVAIPGPSDYGRVVGSAVHFRSNPHLLDKPDSVPGVKNITDSQLGNEWRYWSHQFQCDQEDPTKHLMLQINGVLRHA